MKVWQGQDSPQLTNQAAMLLSGSNPEQVIGRGAEGNASRQNSRLGGWIVEEGSRRGVRVAPWVFNEQKRLLYSSLVGFLKSNLAGFQHVESWFVSCWGKTPNSMQLLDDQVVWMHFSTHQEANEVLAGADTDNSGPFLALERWMEVLGSPPCPVWVKVRGLPLQAWHEETFKLIGECIVCTVEVDDRTKEEYLKEGRIRLLLDRSVTLPLSIPIWVEDLQFNVLVEMAEEDDSLQENMKRSCGKEGNQPLGRRCTCRRKVEDDDVSKFYSNFKSPASVSKGEGVWAREVDKPMELGPGAL